MRSRDVFDQMLRPNEPAHTPASGVKILACRADCESECGYFWRQGGDAGEWNVEEAVVDFVGKDQDIIFYAEVTNCLEFGFGEDFADGVVWCIENDHTGFRVDRFFEGRHVYQPVSCRGILGGAVFGWLKWDIADNSAGHLDIGDISNDISHSLETYIHVPTDRRMVRIR